MNDMRGLCWIKVQPPFARIRQGEPPNLIDKPGERMLCLHGQTEK